MSTVGVFIDARINQFRLYTFAIIFYIGIASLIALPAINRIRTQDAVRSNLAQYLKGPRIHTASTAAIQGVPASISIKRLNINLPAAPGYYNLITNKWTLDSSHVFVDNYTNPGATIGTDQQHITFMYGHDIPGVLIKTSQLSYGDIMTINTSNGYQFRYYYDKSRVISPNDTGILKQKNTGDSVVLATCTGAWYQFRHAMYFKLISVRKLPNGHFMKVDR